MPFIVFFKVILYYGDCGKQIGFMYQCELIDKLPGRMCWKVFRIQKQKE